MPTNAFGPAQDSNFNHDLGNGCPCRIFRPGRLSCGWLCPAVLMIKSAEDGLCSDVTEPLDGTKQRRILGQSKMGSDMVAVGSIGFEDPAQLALAEDHDVIQARPTNRANQPFALAKQASTIRSAIRDSISFVALDHEDARPRRPRVRGHQRNGIERSHQRINLCCTARIFWDTGLKANGRWRAYPAT